MKKKYLSILMVVLVAAMVLAGCSSGNGSDEPVEEADRVFTLEELAEYDGTDGSEAYVAVDGVVYDVTDSDMWNAGSHNGYQAGQDLSEEIKDISPHGVSVLDRMPIVGTLEE
ncbi:cytochrome b5 domain-containing protein [Gudongella sp. DL1XJH-153]|uniref:cytochrome b5 domain-containing protein n=1 Tax=Gudongella sp. DL1XJH-153 TaxID=3409804 RepID=UPI003BB680C8